MEVPVIIWLCQIVFGAAALATTAAAAWSVARNGHRGSYYLCVAGAFSLVFFLTVPEVLPELVILSGLAIVTGAVLMPVESRRSFQDSRIRFMMTSRSAKQRREE
jgi:hypothetical protein